MEIREWAERILSAETLQEKLLDPGELTDSNSGSPLLFSEPSRPAHMQLCKRTKEEKLPPFQEHGDPDKRAACLHRFAGHELLAVEIMAQALLAFPTAPSAFRRGVAHTLLEEQEHVRLYMNRLEELGVCFGDMPLYRHFWNHVPYLTCPLRYISVMSLPFEMANLDFAPLYGKSFAHFNDVKSAALMAQIEKDEIHHVAFGWRWLQKLKDPVTSSWDAWAGHLTPKLNPKRARGFVLHEENRRKASIPDDWIQRLKNY